MATDSSPSEPQSRLLTLPAELRNTIWRMVLIEDDSIHVTADGFRTEGIMQVCKKVRNEVLKIRYYENLFVVATPRYDPSTSVMWYRYIKSLGLNIDMRMIEERKNVPNYDGVTWWDMRRHGRERNPHWGNLVLWMRLVHAGKTLGNLTTPMEYFKRAKTSRRSLIIKGLFATVEDLKALPWEAVEKIIGHHRPALATLDDRWMDDEEPSESLLRLSKLELAT